MEVISIIFIFSVSLKMKLTSVHCTFKPTYSA